MSMLPLREFSVKGLAGLMNLLLTKMGGVPPAAWQGLMKKFQKPKLPKLPTRVAHHRI